MKSAKFRKALIQSLNTFKTSLPILFGTLLLVNLGQPFAQNWYAKIFTGNYILDPLLGALAGSVSFGMPITSYVVGGELLKQGVSLLAVTAFILAWTTVGVAMLPLEAQFLGKRFAVVRNALNFIFAILISVITIFILKLF